MVDPNFNISGVPGKIPREMRKKAEGVPPTKKDFKKVLKKEEGDERDRDKQRKQTKDVATKEKETPEVAEKDIKEGKVQSDASLFTLSQEAAKKNAAIQKEAGEQEIAAVSTERESQVKGREEIPAPFFAPPEQVVAKEEPKAQFSQEQPDIAYVNPLNMGEAVQQVGIASQAERPTLTPEQVQQIIAQMVEKVQTLTKEGQTDTTLVLRHPPILEGANLIIRSFDTARGEFNISFENLSLQAKNMLDMQGNQDALKLALENKGYVMHILTTTTTTETPVVEEEGQASFAAKEDEQQQQQDEGEA